VKLALNFYRPSRETHYEHLDALFSETVNWDLIAEHLDDMLRVAVSIKAWKLMPSTILRKLGSYLLMSKTTQSQYTSAWRKELGDPVTEIFQRLCA